MSTPAHRRRWTLNACLGAALALSACNRAEPTVTPDGQTTPTTSSDAAVNPAPVDGADQMLPRDTVLLVSAASVARVGEVFERDRLVEVFSAQYGAVSGMLTGSVGYDLLDPAAWANVGLDANGPLGIALADPVEGRFAAFATIADRGKVVGFIRDLAGRNGMEMVEQPYGDVSVFRPAKGGEMSVVLRGDVVALVRDRPRETGMGLAQVMATLDPTASLATRVGYRKATGGLRPSDATLYVDVAGMVGQLGAAAEARAAEPQSNWAQEQLIEAQKEGSSPEQLADLERMVEEERERQERWRRRDAGERALAELLASGIEGMGFTATVKRDGPIFDGRVVAGEDAFLRRLMSNRQGEPLLPTVMKGAPLWCMAGRVGADPAFELLRGIVAADGEDYDAFITETKAMLGLDLEVDVRPALAGDAAMCVTMEGKLEASDELAKKVGLGAYVEVTDEAKAKYLLAKVSASASGPLAGRVRKAGAGYSVANPKWRTLYLQAVGNRIVVSSDPDLATRITKATPGSMPSKIRPEAARGAMMLPGTAAANSFDLAFTTLWLTARSMSFDESSPVAPGMTAEEMAKVPHSRKSKKARKALQQAREELAKIERKREAQQFEMLIKMTDPIGMSVVAVTEDERGFTVAGGQFLRVPSLGQVVETLITGAMSAGQGQSELEIESSSNAWENRMEASQAYQEARMEDAERAKGRKSR